MLAGWLYLPITSSFQICNSWNIWLVKELFFSRKIHCSKKANTQSRIQGYCVVYLLQIEYRVFDMDWGHFIYPNYIPTCIQGSDIRMCILILIVPVYVFNQMVSVFESTTISLGSWYFLTCLHPQLYSAKCPQ